MAKSKYGSPTYPTVKTVESGDPSKDVSRVDRSGTASSGPTSDFNSDKTAAGTLGKSGNK